MYKELREKAEKKVEAKKTFYNCVIIFPSIALVLLMLSFYLTGASFWLRLPIPILMMVLGVVYINAFGWSSSSASSEAWEEAEIEKELVRRFQQKKAQLPPLEELTETELLELKELERLKEKWGRDEEYV